MSEHKRLTKTQTEALVEAALSQPKPTPELAWALNRCLDYLDHPDRLEVSA